MYSWSILSDAQAASTIFRREGFERTCVEGDSRTLACMLPGVGRRRGSRRLCIARRLCVAVSSSPRSVRTLPARAAHVGSRALRCRRKEANDAMTVRGKRVKCPVFRQGGGARLLKYMDAYITR